MNDSTLPPLELLAENEPPPQESSFTFFRDAGPREYFWALLLVGAITLLGFELRQVMDTNAIAMFYLLGVVGIAGWLGLGPALAASLSGVLALDYFMIPPYFSFAVLRSETWMTLVVMLVVSLVISTLASRLREQAHLAREREFSASMLYDLSRALADSRGGESFLGVAAHHLGETVGAQVRILLTDPQGGLIPPNDDPRLFPGKDWSAIQWVLSYRLATGRGLSRRNPSDGIYLPLLASQGLLGILAFYFPENLTSLSREQIVRLETFASQVALALERNLLSREAEDNRISAENEKNRSALLSAVSHDLRTPLTAIQGAAGSLLANDKILTAVERAQLSRSIYEESDRMNRLVQNLLDMTRLESGALHLKKEWQSVEELVGAALDLLKGRFSNHPLALKLEPGLPLVLMDGLLMEQLLLNLLENALNHTPPGTPIELSAQRSGENLELEVSDRGPGLLPGEENSIFEKFNRGSQPGKSGVGLGLSICRGIANAHGGIVSASIRPGGGASFLARLPIGGKAPDMKEE